VTSALLVFQVPLESKASSVSQEPRVLLDLAVMTVKMATKARRVKPAIKATKESLAS